MNKKISLVLLILAILGLLLGTAFAQDGARTDYQKARAEFLKTRQAARTPEAREAALLKGKEMAKKMADRLIAEAEKIKTKVNETKDLDEADKTQIISRINAHIATLNDLKAKIDNAATNEELRNVVKELRTNLQTAKRFSKHFVGRLLVHRINKAIERIAAAIQKAETKIAELRAAGKDVTKLENLLNDAKTNLDAAKAEYQKAKDKYQEVATLEGFAKLTKEANRFAREANKYLILAHKAVQRLIPEVNKLIKREKPTKPQVLEQPTTVTETETATPLETQTETQAEPTETATPTVEQIQ
jgi:DNA repair exonuclease SbcCD ATPase subunit